jgi:hypothetical protein
MVVFVLRLLCVLLCKNCLPRKPAAPVVTIDCVVTASSSRKRSQLLVSVHNKAPSVVAVRVCNKDWLTIGIDR